MMSPRWTDCGIALALVVGVVLVFYPALGCAFSNYDDPRYVSENAHVLDGLNWDNFTWAWATFDCANWHPLTWLSLQVDASLFGTAPAVFHRTSLALHALNAVLLYGALFALTGARWPSAGVAALWALHPLRAESVVWVAERKDVLSVAFGLSALWLYAKYARRPRIWIYLSMLLVFVLSLLAKPMLVTVPCLLLLLDSWPLRRWPTSGKTNVVWLIAEKLPLLALVAALSAVTVLAQRQGGAVVGLQTLSLPQRFGNAIVAYATYLGEVVWPLELGVFYPRPMAGWSVSRIASSLVLLVSLSALAVWQSRRRPYLLLGWLWYLGTLVPVIGLVQVGNQAWADRYTYFPIVGILVAATWFGAELAKKAVYRLPILLLVCLVLIGEGALAHIQTGYWHDSLALWSHNLAVAGESYTTDHNLAKALEERGQRDEALVWFHRATLIEPNNPEGHLSLGTCLLAVKRNDEAIRAIQATLALNPRYALAHNNLGCAYGNLGQHAEAQREFRVAVDCDPQDGRAWNNLGMSLAVAGAPEAAEAFTEAVHRSPRNADAHRNLGILLEKEGNVERGLQHLTRAVELKPDSTAFRMDLACALDRHGDWVTADRQWDALARQTSNWPAVARAAAWALATDPDSPLRNGRRALQLAQQACAATQRRDWAALDALAAAEAENGRFDAAIATVREALSRVQTQQQSSRTLPPGLAQVAALLQEHLALYEKHEPCRGGKLAVAP